MKPTDDENQERPSKPFQFSIRHLLLAMLVVGLCLTLFNSGFGRSIAVTIGWLANRLTAGCLEVLRDAESFVIFLLLGFVAIFIAQLLRLNARRPPGR